jgi:hypothetical protein
MSDSSDSGSGVGRAGACGDDGAGAGAEAGGAVGAGTGVGGVAGGGTGAGCAGAGFRAGAAAQAGDPSTVKSMAPSTIVKDLLKISTSSRLLKKVTNAAAGEKKPEAQPLGYVEDFFEPRTKLGKRRVPAHLGNGGWRGGLFSAA